MRNRAEKRRAERTQRASATDSQALRARARDRARSRPLRAVIACAILITTVFTFTINTSALAQGNNVLQYRNAIPFANVTLQTGTETLSYDNNSIGLYPNEAITNRTENKSYGQQQLIDQFWSIKHIEWYPKPTRENNENWSLKTPQFWCDASLSEFYTEILVNATGIIYQNDDLGITKIVYRFSTQTWEAERYKTITFSARLHLNSSTAYDDYFLYNAVIGEYFNGTSWINTNRYRRMDTPMIATKTNTSGLWNMSFNTNIPTSWFATENHGHVSMRTNAGFAIKMRANASEVFNGELKTPIININTISGNSSDASGKYWEHVANNFKITLACDFSIMTKNPQANYTVNGTKTYEIHKVMSTETYSNIEYGTNGETSYAVRFPAVPFSDIYYTALKDNQVIENGAYVYIENLMYVIEFDMPNNNYYYDKVQIECQQRNYDYTQGIKAFNDYYLGAEFNTYPDYSSAETVPFIVVVSSTVASFLNTELFGTFSIGDLLLVVIAIGVVFILLKLFAGG